MLANKNLAADMDLATPYGRVVVVGNRGEISINPRVAMTKELDIRGLQLWNTTESTIATIMSDILEGVGDGTLRPAVGREMPLAEAAAAHTAVLGTGNGGKLVLVP
jgi:NADPH2:quinone reductase